LAGAGVAYEFVDIDNPVSLFFDGFAEKPCWAAMRQETRRRVPLYSDRNACQEWRGVLLPQRWGIDWQTAMFRPEVGLS
jgi:hypothetical protein